MKVLIIGGNRFVGKKLAIELLKRGNDVTILNRGTFAESVVNPNTLRAIPQIVADRDDPNLANILGDTVYDIVYDQVCFTQKQALEAVRIFESRCKRYIFISSLSVHDEGPNLAEDTFDPNTYITKTEVIDRMADYQEAKRQCEVVFSKSPLKNHVLIRFPYIIGEDDYTKRFAFHIDHIRSAIPFIAKNVQPKLSFIYSTHAAMALADLAVSSFTGTLGLSSRDVISIKELFELIKSIHGGKILIQSEQPTIDSGADVIDVSPYADIDNDWYQNVDLALSLGLELPALNEWLPDLIRNM